MRTARTVVDLCLLAGLLALPSQSLGQSEGATNEAQQASPVSFETTTSGITGWVRDDGYAEVHGYVTAEDPRASGRMVLVAAIEEVPSGTLDPETGDVVMTARYTGVARIENDRGGLAGSCLWGHLPRWHGIELRLVHGEGAYDGFSLFGIYDGPQDAAVRRETDMIWAGPPPPLPDPTLLAD